MSFLKDRQVLFVLKIIYCKSGHETLMIIMGSSFVTSPESVCFAEKPQHDLLWRRSWKLHENIYHFRGLSLLEYVFKVERNFAAPVEWTQVPVVVKIYKLLINELSNQIESSMSTQQGEDDDEVSSQSEKG